MLILRQKCILNWLHKKSKMKKKRFHRVNTQNHIKWHVCVHQKGKIFPIYVENIYNVFHSIFVVDLKLKI